MRVCVRTLACERSDSDVATAAIPFAVFDRSCARRKRDAIMTSSRVFVATKGYERYINALIQTPGRNFLPRRSSKHHRFAHPFINGDLVRIRCLHAHARAPPRSSFPPLTAGRTEPTHTPHALQADSERNALPKP